MCAFAAKMVYFVWFASVYLCVKIHISASAYVGECAEVKNLRPIKTVTCPRSQLTAATKIRLEPRTPHITLKSITHWREEKKKARKSLFVFFSSNQ